MPEQEKSTIGKGQVDPMVMCFAFTLNAKTAFVDLRTISKTLPTCKIEYKAQTHIDGEPQEVYFDIFCRKINIEVTTILELQKIGLYKISTGGNDILAERQ